MLTYSTLPSGSKELTVVDLYIHINEWMSIQFNFQHNTQETLPTLTKRCHASLHCVCAILFKYLRNAWSTLHTVHLFTFRSQLELSAWKIVNTRKMGWNDEYFSEINRQILNQIGLLKRSFKILSRLWSEWEAHKIKTSKFISIFCSLHFIPLHKILITIKM